MSVGDPQPGLNLASAEERIRLADAFAKAAGENGLDRLELHHVARYAGLPESRIEDVFETKEQGLLAAQDVFLERLLEEATNACAAVGGEWPRKIAAGVEAVLGLIIEASSLARALVVEASAASIAGAQRQAEGLDRFAALLRDGRRAYPEAADLPDATERVLIGGIASIVSACLLAEDPRALIALEPQLVESVLIPYMGIEASRASLS